jgi:hypothetical protein
MCLKTFADTLIPMLRGTPTIPQFFDESKYVSIFWEVKYKKIFSQKEHGSSLSCI